MTILSIFQKGSERNPQGLRIEPFDEAHLAKLLKWTTTERELRLWSGGTFDGIPDEATFRGHLTRPRVHPYQATDKWGRLTAYAELVQLAEGSGTLCRVIVDPRRRGMGMGKAFVEQLMREAFEQHRFKRLLLNVFTFNAPALRCYRSLGFRPLPRSPKPRAYEGKVWNLIIMEKQAPAKAA